MSVSAEHTDQATGAQGPARLTREELPAWVRAGEWTWHGHTGVAGGTCPDGYLTPNAATGEQEPPRFGLDLICVDAAWPSPVATEAERALAHLLWTAGSVAVLDEAAHGAPTLLVPGAAFDYNLFFAAVHRFALWAGMDEQAAFTCSAQVALPHTAPIGIADRWALVHAHRERLLPNPG